MSPSGQVSGRVEVGMGRMPTPDAKELRLTAPIAFVHKATPATCPAAVAWVHEDHRDTGLLCFVADKLPQLVEAPSVMPVALAFANRHPVANVRQVFQHKRGFRVFGTGHKLFRDHMIYVTTKARFIARHLFESPLGTPGVCRLIGLPSTTTALADDFNRGSCVGFAVRVRGKIHDTQIHAKKPCRLHRRFSWGVDGHEQKEGAIDQHQIGLALGAVELDALVVAHLHRDDGTAMQRRQARFSQAMKRQDAFVIDDGTIRPKGHLFRLVALVGFDRLCNGANGQLSRQPKALAHLVVERFLQEKLRGTAMLKGVLRNPGTRRIEGVHRLQQGGMLVGRGKQFHLQRCFHIERLYHKGSPKTNAVAAMQQSPLSLGPEGPSFPENFGDV